MPDYEALKAENDELIRQDEFENRAVPRGLPHHVGLHTTTACNLKCIFCLQADGLVPVVAMEEEVFNRAGQALFPTARVVQLTASGEPLMTPRLAQVLDALAHFGCRLDVITNATLLKDRKVLRQAAELADTFTFSIDGATRETYESVRIGADFDEVMENIRFWNRLRLSRPRLERPRMAFHFILMRRTIRDLSAMVEIAHAFRADLVSTAHLSEHREEVRGQSLTYARAESNHYMELARSRARELGVNLDGPPPFALEPAEQEAALLHEWPAPVAADPRLLQAARSDAPEGAEHGGADLSRWQENFPPPQGGGPRCQFLWGWTYISPSGDVLTCCHPDAEFMGNVRERPFGEIWRGARYAEYRQRLYSASPVPICDACFIIGRSGRTLPV